MAKSFWSSLVAQTVKNLPVMQKTWVQSLVWEDPLEEGMATPPVFLPGESPRTEEPGRLQSMEFSRPENWSGQPFPSPGVFPSQGSHLGLPHCRQILYPLSHQGSPRTLE